MFLLFFSIIFWSWLKPSFPIYILVSYCLLFLELASYRSWILSSTFPSLQILFFQFWFPYVIPYQGDNYIIIQINKFLEVKLQFLFFGTHVLRNLFLKIFPLFGQILITGLQFFRALYSYRVFLPHIAKRCTGDKVGEKNEISCRYEFMWNHPLSYCYW